MSNYGFMSRGNEYEFSSDNINVFLMVLDSSTSMRDDIENVRMGLESYKNEFENFYEADSISVAVSEFNDDYYPGAFRKVKEMSTKYYADGSTALCYSIIMGAKQLMNYMEEVQKRNGTIPRGTFIFFSDGEPCCDRASYSDAKESISKMNYAGITTVFVAFGEAISSEFGKKMGFQSTIDVRDRKSLVKFMGKELSKSCKEQSQSLKALGENFFSQATNESSSNYSKATEQALEDDGWIDQI